MEPLKIHRQKEIEKWFAFLFILGELCFCFRGVTVAAKSIDWEEFGQVKIWGIQFSLKVI